MFLGTSTWKRVVAPHARCQLNRRRSISPTRRKAATSASSHRSRPSEQLLGHVRLWWVHDQFLASYCFHIHCHGCFGCSPPPCFLGSSAVFRCVLCPRIRRSLRLVSTTRGLDDYGSLGVISSAGLFSRNSRRRRLRDAASSAASSDEMRTCCFVSHQPERSCSGVRIRRTESSRAVALARSLSATTSKMGWSHHCVEFGGGESIECPCRALSPVRWEHKFGSVYRGL